jgi:hypothetical protein
MKGTGQSKRVPTFKFDSLACHRHSFVHQFHIVGFHYLARAIAALFAVYRTFP